MVKISKNPSKIHTPNNEMQSHRPSFYNEGYHVSRTNETETAKKRTPNRSVFFPRYSALPRMRSEPVQTVAQIYFLFSRTGIGSDKNFGVRKHGHNINVPVFVVARSFPDYTSKSPTGRKLPRTSSIRVGGERRILLFEVQGYPQKRMETRRVLRTRHKNTRTRERWNSAARPMTGLYGHWKIRTAKAGNCELSRYNKSGFRSPVRQSTGMFPDRPCPEQPQIMRFHRPGARYSTPADAIRNRNSYRLRPLRRDRRRRSEKCGDCDVGIPKTFGIADSDMPAPGDCNCPRRPLSSPSDMPITLRKNITPRGDSARVPSGSGCRPGSQDGLRRPPSFRES